jgi:hypothetical protein
MTCGDLSGATRPETRRTRPARQPSRSSAAPREPIRVQRGPSNTGVIMAAGQRFALGRLHQHRTVTIAVSDTTVAIKLDDGDVKVMRRTTTPASP